MRAARTTHRYTVATDDPETAAALLVAAGALGAEVQARHAVAWFDTLVATEDLPIARGAWTVEPGQDWLARWKEGLEPVVVGRVAVVPSWWVGETPDADVRLVIDPGMAFGTGHHATTRGCLEHLQRLDLTGLTVLDVGTGSGILALAAVRLGADAVVAVDNDPEAVEVARANLAVNGVAVQLVLGGPEVVASETRELPAARTFDVVLANLVSDTLVALAGNLAALTRSGGHLVAGGIGSEHVDRVLAAFGEHNLTTVDRTDLDGWVTITLARSQP